VAGDLNEEAGGAAYDLIVGRYPIASGGAPTFPANRTTAALDAVFAGAGLRPVSTAPSRFDDRDVLAGSDHRPVWVDLDLHAARPDDR
jgi:endonuclease/exonuclease/phosphatase family metal-dependent hydrolase